MRARKLVRGLRQGLSEDERYPVADDVIDHLQQHGDPWRLSEELPEATGRGCDWPLTAVDEGQKPEGRQQLNARPKRIGVMAEVEEAEPQPDLVWDDQVRGLCVRIFGNGSKSFFFVYRINDRQRFIRIGRTPVWSLEAAQKRRGSSAQLSTRATTPRTTFANPILSKMLCDTSPSIGMNNEACPPAASRRLGLSRIMARH
jgi:hypothetical protein